MADVLMAAVLVIDVADCALASAAPFAGMTQTGSMGLISAAQTVRHPKPLAYHRQFHWRAQEQRGSRIGGRSDRRANGEPSNL
jgi:hypothetical protein